MWCRWANAVSPGCGSADRRRGRIGAELAGRHLRDRKLPDKAIDLIDEAGSNLRLQIDSMPTEIDQLSRKITQLEIERQALLKEKDKASKERLAKLAGGVAVIKVAAATESELKERKDRVDDALHATRAAVEEGIVPGGGVALIRAVADIMDLKGDNHDQDIGINIARRAMEEPLRQIVANAGAEASVVTNNVEEHDGNYGYNAANGEYGDMIEMGILDPTKVTRSALQNAASVAGLLITTECMIAEMPKDEAPAGAPDMGGMGGMGGMM